MEQRLKIVMTRLERMLGSDFSRWRETSDTDLCMESLSGLELDDNDIGKKMFKTPTITKNNDTVLNIVKFKML